MVTSPNYRHPVTLAKELVALDDVSNGRLVVGVGAGGSGHDAAALGGRPWTPRERADRFDEFVPMLDHLLTETAATAEGRYWTAADVRSIPGCVQRPRAPLYVAATGPRGLALAARHGQGWITYGHPRTPGDFPEERCAGVVADQVDRLARACARTGRDVGALTRVLLQGFTVERPLDSLEAFVDYAGRHREAGITEIAIHWPLPGTPYAADRRVFELIATEGLARLGDPAPGAEQEPGRAR
jgi:alkanesulfonate monooxygenase SsuD/methylene tetrahydromethanopterin reductase-like flavin-dependent oxidoreductase (luciferase family)